MRSYRQSIVSNEPENVYICERMKPKASQQGNCKSTSGEPPMEKDTCPFCQNRELLFASNQHAFAIPDRRPVSSGHSLIVSYSHVATIFDLPLVEYAACFELVREVKELLSKDKNTESFNVVVNCGPNANQTVDHAHIHLVPRYRGVPLPSATDAWSSIR